MTPESPALSPEMIAKRNEEWAKDLDLNGDKKAKGHMRIGECRCCLAVAEDTARRLGAVFESNPNNVLPSHHLPNFFGWAVAAESQTKLIPFLVIPKPDPMAAEPGTTHLLASNLNDAKELGRITKKRAFLTEGLTHPQIAECVRHTFCGRTEPWSFEF